MAIIDNRRHFRLRRFIDIKWQIEAQGGISGIAKVYNLSLSGLQISTDQPFNTRGDVIFTLSSDEIKELPKFGRLKWHRALSNPSKGTMCGVAFVKDNFEYSPTWKKWMEDNISKLADVGDTQILANYLGNEDA